MDDYESTIEMNVFVFVMSQFFTLGVFQLFTISQKSEKLKNAHKNTKKEKFFTISNQTERNVLPKFYYSNRHCKQTANLKN